MKTKHCKDCIHSLGDPLHCQEMPCIDGNKKVSIGEVIKENKRLREQIIKIKETLNGLPKIT